MFLNIQNWNWNYFLVGNLRRRWSFALRAKIETHCTCGCNRVSGCSFCRDIVSCRRSWRAEERWTACFRISEIVRLYFGCFLAFVQLSLILKKWINIKKYLVELLKINKKKSSTVMILEQYLTRINVKWRNRIKSFKVIWR